jgi:hypothetical protein
MKTPSVRYALAVGLAALPGLLQAQPTAHYVPGSEGIKGASLPPPGLYLRDYNAFYYASKLNDFSGNKITALNEFRAFTYANVPRLIWISDIQILGGNLGVDGLLPFVYQNLRIPPFYPEHSSFGIGDFFAEGTLSWHLTQFDLSAGAGAWAPTGDSIGANDIATTRAGQGYWTPMLTAGATWYLDGEKTWAVSALNRYEFNTEQRDTHITPGQAYTLEWGVSKTIEKVYDIGAVGYYQQQVTEDSGTGSTGNRDRVAGVGPEFCVAYPQQMFFVSLRYVYEFAAEGRAQGNTWTLTLTKRF